MKGVARRNRTVGLDKPCSRCGKPIHHTYVGPIKGVCGRCADGRRRKRVRTVRLGHVVKGPKWNERGGKAPSLVKITLAMIAGGAAVAFVLSKLFG